MFAVLTVEQEPPGFRDLPLALVHWTETVGFLAMVGVLLWTLIGLPFMRADERARIPRWQRVLFVLGLIAASVCYSCYGVVALITPAMTGGGSATAAQVGDILRHSFLVAGGACGILIVSLPFLRGLTAISPRRVWALARLSFKEAIGRRVLYAFSFLLLIFLFGSWFITSKQEDQVRSYVSVVFTVMSVLLLVAAGLLAAFSIPADIRQQTIHTVLTKPVQRFEIVLGRFLGFTALMTLVLVFMSALCLLYIVRGVDPDAAAESLKARDPLYGELSFEGTTNKAKGDSVGREWDYRGYIAGFMPGQQAPQAAVWRFDHVPSALAGHRVVPCEFGFDVYRTTKGYENVGINCSFVFTTWRFRPERLKEYEDRRDKERAKTEGRLSDFDIDNLLAEEFGYYKIPSTAVVDFHTQSVLVPGGLFKNALAPDPARRQELDQRRGVPPPAPVQARVECRSATQYIGMAKHDLYLRLDDPEGGHDRLWFAWNFFKSASGLWLQLCLVIGVAVALSTYLSGVISAIGTAVLYLLGVVAGFIQEVALGKTQGGGPMEAALRLARRENLATPLEETTINRVAQGSDSGFRAALKLLLHVIPNVDGLDFSGYSAEGFNVPLGQIVVTTIFVIGYLLPWIVLGYYALKWREIASAA